MNLKRERVCYLRTRNDVNVKAVKESTFYDRIDSNPTFIDPTVEPSEKRRLYYFKKTV